MSGSSTEGDNREQDLVKMVVDGEVCIAGGQCELLAPEVFEIDEDRAVSVVVGTGCVDRAAAETIIDRCPSGAVSMVDHKT